MFPELQTHREWMGPSAGSDPGGSGSKPHWRDQITPCEIPSGPLKLLYFLPCSHVFLKVVWDMYIFIYTLQMSKGKLKGPAQSLMGTNGPGSELNHHPDRLQHCQGPGEADLGEGAQGSETGGPGSKASRASQQAGNRTAKSLGFLICRIRARAP